MEGATAAAALRRARETPAQNAPMPPATAEAAAERPIMMRRLLRVLTATELAAQHRAIIRREVFGLAVAGAMCVAALYGASRLLAQRRER